MAYFSEIPFFERKSVIYNRLKESLLDLIAKDDSIQLIGSLQRSCFCLLKSQQGCTVLSDIDLLSRGPEKQDTTASTNAIFRKFTSFFLKIGIESPNVSIKYIDANRKYLEDHVFLHQGGADGFTYTRSGTPNLSDIRDLGFLHMIGKNFVTDKNASDEKKLYKVAKCLRPVSDIFYAKRTDNIIVYRNRDFVDYVRHNYHGLNSFLRRFLARNERDCLYAQIMDFARLTPSQRVNNFHIGDILRKAFRFTLMEYPNSRVRYIFEDNQLT